MRYVKDPKNERGARTIRRLRLMMCLSQVKLAKELGMCVSAISMYENARQMPNITTTQKLIDIAAKHKIKLSMADFREI